MEYFILWIILGFVAAGVATGKGRSFWPWFFAGFFFGPFALIYVVFFLSSDADPSNIVKEGTSPPSEIAITVDKRTNRFVPAVPGKAICPECDGTISSLATICRHCKTKFNQPIWQIKMKPTPEQLKDLNARLFMANRDNHPIKIQKVSDFPKRYDKASDSFVPSVPLTFVCPGCNEEISWKAKKCPSCHTQFDKPIWMIKMNVIDDSAA